MKEENNKYINAPAVTCNDRINGTECILPDEAGSSLYEDSGPVSVSGPGLNLADLIPGQELTLQTIQDWENIFNTVTDMITIHDMEFNIVYANKAAGKMLGLPFLDFPKKKCFKYYHGAENPPEGCPTCKCLKTGESVNFEVSEPHLNMYMEIRAIPRLDRNNQVIGLIHIVRDITERKKIEDAVNEAKSEWEMTFDSVLELVLIIDKELNIVRCNKSFADFFGKRPEEIVGCKCNNFFPCTSQRAEGCKKRIRKGESTHVEIQTKCGHWFNVNHQQIPDNKRGIEKTIIVASDITNLKNTQGMLEASQGDLKKQLEELEKFYDMAVGRELRMVGLKKELRKMKAEVSQYKKEDNGDKDGN